VNTENHNLPEQKLMSRKLTEPTTEGASQSNKQAKKKPKNPGDHSWGGGLTLGSFTSRDPTRLLYGKAKKNSLLFLSGRGTEEQF
jgi:hypothetical protein